MHSSLYYLPQRENPDRGRRYYEICSRKKQFRALILAPNTNIIADWKERIHKDLQPLQDRIDIKTYSYAVRHYHEKTGDYYSYIVVDEAHHAVAPMLKRVINTMRRNSS
mgnify:CR=1 FL=1